MQEKTAILCKTVSKEGPMYYVYMILCQGGGYYTGLTNDLPHRMRAHAAGKG
ncbi:MAG: GIY-YIG nuclease family protein, partial [Oscillospiraceae bacterium]|nr:GIY-YIG nuclease family protein [Oscillospiraceae bacterium]